MKKSKRRDLASRFCGLAFCLAINCASAQTSSDIEDLPLADLYPIDNPHLENPEVDDLETRIDDFVYKMSNAEKAAQMILVYFSDDSLITEHQFGGVLIMQNMLKKPAEIVASLERMQTNSKIEVFVSIDQEGGKVNRMKRLPGWNKVPSAKAIRDWDSTRITDLTEKIAIQLQEIGINMNLAPVLDPSIDYLGRNTFMEQSSRSFGENGGAIIPNARAFISGFSEHGVMTINKHFPGYDVASNSDHDIAVSQAPFENILENTSSFTALSEASTGVMMSSILFADTDDKPAVLSDLMVGWARALYGDGLIMTDDLWGVALRSWISPESSTKDYPDDQFLKLVKMALLAGNDILMITYPEKAVLMKEAIAEWMLYDEQVAFQVNESVRRIVRTKLKRAQEIPY